MASQHKHNSTHQKDNQKGDQQDPFNQIQNTKDQALSKRILELRAENYDTAKGWEKLSGRLPVKSTEVPVQQLAPPSDSQRPQQKKSRPLLSFWKMAVAAMVLLAAGFIVGRYSNWHKTGNQGQVAIQRPNTPIRQSADSKRSAKAVGTSRITSIQKDTKATGTKRINLPGPINNLHQDAYTQSSHKNKVHLHHNDKKANNTALNFNNTVASVSTTGTNARKTAAQSSIPSLDLNKSMATIKPDAQTNNRQVIDKKLAVTAMPIQIPTQVLGQVSGRVSKQPWVSGAETNNSSLLPSSATEAQDQTQTSLPVIALSAIHMEAALPSVNRQMGHQNNTKSNIYKTLSRKSGASSQNPFKIRF